MPDEYESPIAAMLRIDEKSSGSGAASSTDGEYCRFERNSTSRSSFVGKETDGAVWQNSSNKTASIGRIGAILLEDVSNISQ